MKILTLLVLAVLLFSGCSKTDEEKYKDTEKALMASVSDLTKTPPKTDLTNDPYVHGKIAVFQELEAKAAYQKGVYFMHPLYYRELKDDYATKPEEVGTVALVSCKTTEKGVYRSDNGQEHPAMVEDCELTMIDRSKQAVVFKKTFEATPSQERMVIANSVTKQSSQSDIAEFLKGLPKE